MSRIYDKPVIVQKINEATEKWDDLYTLHACINKDTDDEEFLSSGAIRAVRTLNIEVRWFKAIVDIAINTQSYRVMYRNVPYNITDYDDFMEQHKTVKLTGKSY